MSQEAKKKSLFDVDFELQQVYLELEENGGELTPELEERLNIAKEDEETKLRAYFHILRRNDADMLLLKDERDRLAKRSKSIENFGKNLKKRVVEYLLVHGNTNKSGTKGLKFVDFSVSTRDTESVNYDSELSNGLVEAIINNFELGFDIKDLDSISNMELTIKVKPSNIISILELLKGKIENNPIPELSIQKPLAKDFVYKLEELNEELELINNNLSNKELDEDLKLDYLNDKIRVSNIINSFKTIIQKLDLYISKNTNCTFR